MHYNTVCMHDVHDSQIFVVQNFCLYKKLQCLIHNHNFSYTLNDIELRLWSSSQDNGIYYSGVHMSCHPDGSLCK